MSSQLTLSTVNPAGYSLIWAIEVCAAPKGMVFLPFWSQIVLNWACLSGQILVINRVRAAYAHPTFLVVPSGI